MVYGISGMQIADSILNPDRKSICLCIISMISYVKYCLFQIMFTLLFGSSTSIDPFSSIPNVENPFLVDNVYHRIANVWKSKVDKVERHTLLVGSVVELVLK